MYPSAFRNHHAVLRLSGLHGTIQFVDRLAIEPLAALAQAGHRQPIVLDLDQPGVVAHGAKHHAGHHRARGAEPAGERTDLDLADRWFARYGEMIVFGSRLLPVIRTFIAFPAGVAKMNMTRFVVYTFLGSLPWCLGLAYVGQVLGEQWDKNDTLKTWFHSFDFVIGIIAILAAVWWVWRHLKNMPADNASIRS